MSKILILDNEHHLNDKIIDISIEGEGALNLYGKTYTIYNDFKDIIAIKRYRGIYVDAKIILSDGKNFTASIEQGIYDKIDAIITTRGFSC